MKSTMGCVSVEVQCRLVTKTSYVSLVSLAVGLAIVAAFIQSSGSWGMANSLERPLVKVPLLHTLTSSWPPAATRAPCTAICSIGWLCALNPARRKTPFKYYRSEVACIEKKERLTLFIPTNVIDPSSNPQRRQSSRSGSQYTQCTAVLLSIQ